LLAALRFSLEIDGYSVRAFPSGETLLQAWPGSGVGCLIVDHILPGISGLGVLETLRQRNVSVPAILITTHPSALFRRRAAELEAAVVEKPLLGDHLTRAIRDQTRAIRPSS
jgi:two-component system, LuxR family, response regulator FixJ